jgi:single-stranded DNA-binding protein
MAGINKVIIVGNLGGEPELKSIGNNKFVCNFSVATSEEWLDKATNLDFLKNLAPPHFLKPLPLNKNT